MPNKIKTNVAYGRYPALINLANEPIVAQRDPNTTSDKYELGQEWINSATDSVWILTSYTAGLPIWTEIDNNNVNLGITWHTNAGLGLIQLAVNAGYTLTNPGAVNTILPVLAVVGSQIFIHDNNAAAANAGFNITQNAGQHILYAGGASVVGIAGGLHAVNNLQQSLSIHLICTTVNTTWTVFTSDFAPLLF